MNSRHYSPADKFLMHIDTGLRTVLGRPQTTERPNPAEDIEESELTEADKGLLFVVENLDALGEGNRVFIRCPVKQFIQSELCRCQIDLGLGHLNLG